MVRAIRVLGVAGLVTVALAAWMAYSNVAVNALQLDIASNLPWFAHQVAFATGYALSFSAGLLAVALTIPRRQRPWSAALLASLILNAYWSTVFSPAVWWTVFPASSAGVPESSARFLVVFQLISSILPPAAPALLALRYTVRAVHSAPQAAPATEERESLDITIEPVRSKAR